MNEIFRCYCYFCVKKESGKTLSLLNVSFATTDIEEITKNVKNTKFHSSCLLLTLTLVHGLLTVGLKTINLPFDYTIIGWQDVDHLILLLLPCHLNNTIFWHLPGRIQLDLNIHSSMEIIVCWISLFLGCVVWYYPQIQRKMEPHHKKWNHDIWKTFPLVTSGVDFLHWVLQIASSDLIVVSLFVLVSS